MRQDWRWSLPECGISGIDLKLRHCHNDYNDTNKAKHVTRILLIAVIAFAIDQFTKWFVVWHLDLLNRIAIDVVPPILNFRMAWNEGVNFGLFSDESDTTRWILIGLAIVISVFLLWWSRQFTGWWAAIFFGAIIGGAMGNVFDRVLHGAVVDFPNMSCCGIYNPYAFNVTDIFVFGGAIALMIFAERLPKQA